MSSTSLFSDITINNSACVSQPYYNYNYNFDGASRRLILGPLQDTLL